MADAMRHRGPDGEGFWISEDGTAGLAHRRLSIIDLSPSGAQPMANEDGSVWTTFNGEIYNFPELRRGLEERGHSFRSQTDTETIVHLYEELGDALPKALIGDYGFAVWDDRRKRSLLVRDRAGVKPLYWAISKGCLVFASEVRAILASGLVAPEIDDEAVYHYFTYLAGPPGRSLIKGVRKLPIGGALSCDQETGNVREWRYWEPLPNRMAVDHRDLDGQLKELLGRSVQKRLLSDVPVGVLFSGGVDSTLNAAMFRDLIAPRAVDTFNVGLGGGVSGDESEIARKMSRHLGTSHHEVSISIDDLLQHLLELTRFQDEPISDPVCVPLYFVTRLARQSGVTVVHGGEGADEIFCGYSNYMRFKRWDRQLWRPLKSMPPVVGSLMGELLRCAGGSRPTFLKVADIAKRAGLGQELFMSSAVALYETEKRQLLSSDFLARMRGIDSFDVVRPLYHRLEEMAPEATFLQRLTFVELNLRLPELLLMRLDKMAMANSVEGRVPFLDHDLIEFAMSVPEAFKLRDGIPKEPVKRLAATAAPKQEMYASKRGFGAPVHEWFRGALAGPMLDLLKDPDVGAEEFVNCARLTYVLERGPRTVNEGFQLWAIFNFLNWKRMLPSYAPAATTNETLRAATSIR